MAEHEHHVLPSVAFGHVGEPIHAAQLCPCECLILPAFTGLRMREGKRLVLARLTRMWFTR